MGISVERARQSPKTGLEGWPEEQNVRGTAAGSHSDEDLLELPVGMALVRIRQGSWADSFSASIFCPSLCVSSWIFKMGHVVRSWLKVSFPNSHEVAILEFKFLIL